MSKWLMGIWTGHGIELGLEGRGWWYFGILIVASAVLFIWEGHAADREQLKRDS